MFFSFQLFILYNINSFINEERVATKVERKRRKTTEGGSACKGRRESKEDGNAQIKKGGKRCIYILM